MDEHGTMSISKKEDTVCVYPWNSAYIDGSIKTCCNSLREPLNDSGNVPGLDDLLTMQDSISWKEIRQNLLKGNKISHCDRCWKMEPNSFRQTQNNWFPETYKKIIDTEISDILPLESLTLAIGNQCNLNCRMCSPDASTMLEKEWSREKKHPLGRNINLRPDLIVSDAGEENIFLSDSRFLEFLDKKGEHLKDIYMFGGEPFIIIEPHLKFLQKLVDLGISKNIGIRYSTNGTNTTLRRFTDLWSKFKKVDIQISCDGMEEVYDYIRWPSKWNKMKENLHYFADLKKNNNMQISVACTMQNLTIEQADRFEKYIKEVYDLGIYYIPVDHPSEFSLKTVPIHVLEKIYINTASERIKNIVNPYIKNYVEDESVVAYNDMLKVVKWQDEYRDQYLFDFFPDIDSWFKGHPLRNRYDD